MTPDALARLHARAFAPARGWSRDEFADLLQSAHVFVTGGASAFALGRVVAGEAELLTLATDPDRRCAGLARAAFAEFETEAARRGAEQAFLEVAEDNAAVLGLYLSVGYSQTGRRRRYYARKDGSPCDALVLTKALAAPRHGHTQT